MAGISHYSSEIRDLDVSLVMAQAALGVKNSAIDMLHTEINALRRENNDLFHVVIQGTRCQPSSTPQHTSTAAAVADTPLSSHSPAAEAASSSSSHRLSAPPAQHSPPPPPPAAAEDALGLRARLSQAEARITALQAAAAEAGVLRQQLQESRSAQAASEGRMGELQEELGAARQHITALEAELQDTMEAAMQLWETVQGNYSEGSASRAGSLYQEQLSPGLFTADGTEDGCGSVWRTPSPSPAPEPSASPTSAAAAAAAAAAGSGPVGAMDSSRLADLAARGAVDRPGSTAGSLLVLTNRSGGSSSGGGGDASVLPHGLFTPIEARVNSLTDKLRGYMIRQPGMLSPGRQSPSPGVLLSPAAAASTAAGAAATSPIAKLAVPSSSRRSPVATPVLLAAGGGADVLAARDVDGASRKG